MALNEQKTAALESSGTITMSGPLIGATDKRRRRMEVFQLILRALCLGTSLVSLSLMITAKQNGYVTIIPFVTIDVNSYWSFSTSFEFLVVVSVAVAAHSLLQLLIGISRFLRASSVIASKKHAWLIFAGDQVFAYALMSAGSAASGASDLNRTGIRHTPFPNFCKTLQNFCVHVAISIVFNFISCFLLTTSVVHDVIWLSQH